MADVNKDDFDDLIEMVEDAVEHSCQTAFDKGRLLSGESAWTAVWAVACAKVLEFEGCFDPE